MKNLIIFTILFANIANAQTNAPLFANDVQPAVFSLTKVMMHDVVNPPAASRYYAYCTMGAYEIVSQNNPAIAPLAKFVKNYQPQIILEKNNEYDYQIAALYCILETGKLMLPSGFMLEEDEKEFIDGLKKNNVKESVIQTSIAVAEKVAASIIGFSKGDNYNKLSTKLRYTPLKGDQYWYPTPPAYIEAIEPNWRIIRPMVIESSDQFMPARLTPFSTDTSSAFFALAKEVYKISINQPQPNVDVANFWDCNPFAISTSGHMMIGFKKISPGGHWMNIAGIAAKTARLNFKQTVIVHTIISIGLMDAFINCWDEKYRSNRIRPETYINRYIDHKWQPILQTPPFPEYTSGHSVVSSCAAEILTYLLGDHFSYTDNSEVIFEIPPRDFHSFNEAASEAAISRLYGGIHYRDAIVNGQVEGKEIGDYVIEKIKSAGIKPLK